MKYTAVAPSNIAFIKYWGRKDEALKLPSNGSISMNLSGLTTTTTVEFSKNLSEDEIVINGTKETPSRPSDFEGQAGGAFEKVVKHLDRIRKLAKIDQRAKVVSENSFPRGTGLSSSASGFAALTLAVTKAAGLQLSEKELSILARQGSGSACRSIPDGFVEWLDGDSSDESYAVSLYPSNYWEIVDIAVILTDQIKDVSTTDGQKSAQTSPFFEERLRTIGDKLVQMKEYLQEKNFQKFGELAEADALEMHAVMLTSNPALIYWYPETITIMKAVQRWRNEGLTCYFTVNTGQNIHILCEKSSEKILTEKLREISAVKYVIASTPAKGAQLIATHLF